MQGDHNHIYILEISLWLSYREWLGVGKKWNAGILLQKQEQEVIVV